MSGVADHFEIVDGEVLEWGSVRVAWRKLQHPSPGAIIQFRNEE
jgi:hypothetical protein